MSVSPIVLLEILLIAGSFLTFGVYELRNVRRNRRP